MRRRGRRAPPLPVGSAGTAAAGGSAEGLCRLQGTWSSVPAEPPWLAMRCSLNVITISTVSVPAGKLRSLKRETHRNANPRPTLLEVSLHRLHEFLCWDTCALTDMLKGGREPEWALS